MSKRPLERRAAPRRAGVAQPATGSVRVGIYLRVSTEDQAQNYGLDVQRDQCRAMATVKGWSVVQVYEDAGISGTKTMRDRPGLAALVKDVRATKVDAVIVAALDRLGRTTRLILDVVDLLTAEDCQLVSCRESLDTSTPTGQFVLTIFAALAQLERDTIVRRTVAGRQKRAEADGEKGGNIPLGYRRVGKGEGLPVGTIVVDPAGAAIVRRIYGLASVGSSLALIAATLNSEGVPTAKRGVSWYASSVREVLSREAVYRGGQRGRSRSSWPMILDSSLSVPARRKRRSRFP